MEKKENVNRKDEKGDEMYQLKRKRGSDGVGVKERDMERKSEREMEKKRYCVYRESEGGRELWDGRIYGGRRRE